MHFTTYFKYPLIPMHLKKDVYKIGEAYSERYHVSHSLVGFSPDIEPRMLNPLIILADERHKAPFDLSWRFILFLFKNRKRIKILNLFFISSDSLIYAFLFKLFSRSGRVYIKADANVKNIENLRLHGGAHRFFLRFVDLISFETTPILNMFKARYPNLAYKSVLIPNGIDTDDTQLKKKDNIFLVVGRIGLPEKNHELLLNAIIHPRCPEWKWIFIGPITPGFNHLIKTFKSLFPKKMSRVSFISDLKDSEIKEYYNRAKVFVMPSHFESFGISFVEALSYGCYPVISRGVLSHTDLLKYYGSIFKSDDVNSLIASLKRSVSFWGNPTIKKIQLVQQCSDYTRENYEWKKVIDPLATL